jgi:hypothetical protein
MCCTIVAMSDYQPGTYVKGEQARICHTPAEAVAATFEGFKLKEDAPVEVETVEQPSQAAVPDDLDQGETDEQALDPDFAATFRDF